MEAMSEQERYAQGNLLRDSYDALRVRAAQTITRLVTRAQDALDDARDVFEDDPDQLTLW